jgi:curved DNA-binding protein CbpA
MKGGGQNQSFVKIYKDLLQIQSARKRADMIRLLMADEQYKQAAREMGLYAHFLGYVAKVDAGQLPDRLPGESVAPQQQQQQHSSLLPFQDYRTKVYNERPSAIVTKSRRNEKALTYFQSCLEVLGLEEEVALTEETLKKAYKRAAIKAHPDKGGTEEDFEAVTRAHAYLGEILQRIKGVRPSAATASGATSGNGSTASRAPTAALQLTDIGQGGFSAMQISRVQDEKRWEKMEPVRLNPKKLDLDAFNKMFEQTRIPDPDEDGYGDWLKAEDSGTGSQPKFSGKFNRDVFNRAFEEEAAAAAARRAAAGGQEEPEALNLAASAVEIGRGRPSSYTAAMNADLHFTDLRNAFTSDNMITTQVADVKVENRNFEKYSAQWKQAPAPLSHADLAAIEAGKARKEAEEMARKARADQELSVADSYFERMKRLVITNK